MVQSPNSQYNGVDTSEPGPTATRRWLSVSAKASLSAALLGLVLWKVPTLDALDGIASLSWTAVVVIVVLTFAFPAVASIRWWRLLRSVGAEQSIWELFADNLVASTYNMLLPTSIGGDVVRALRCGRRIGCSHRAWSTVLFERLVGIIALALFSVPGLAMAPASVRTLGWAVAGVVFVSLIVLVFSPTPLRWIGSVLASRAPAVADVGTGVARDLSGPLSGTAIRAETMFWSLLYQAVGLGILVVVAFDWQQPWMVWAILGGVPLALVLTMLPVSIAGLGIRESMFVVLLGHFGVEASK
ncbi:MAG: flippase-like domain-containing protein, partial [Polyangiaceae bacterium]|nr:flippase-like domain-containing protein [Polyangiaceae bacterium]